MIKWGGHLKLRFSYDRMLDLNASVVKEERRVVKGLNSPS